MVYFQGGKSTVKKGLAKSCNFMQSLKTIFKF